MNTPPSDGLRVGVDDLRRLVAEIFAAVPVDPVQAQRFAQLLVDTELRGVVSHGVTQVERYVRSFQDGTINPDPQPRVLCEGPVTSAWSGDGGLGLWVATMAMERAIDQARQLGVGVATTTYHGHIGSAGKYVRMALGANLIGVCMSGRSAAPSYDLEQTLHGSIQGSPPLAFGVPGGDGRAPFLLDFASHTPWDEDCFRRMPQVFIKAIGLSHVANLLSGTLGGQMLPEHDRRQIAFTAAEQSGFFLALDVERFTPLVPFTEDVDYLMEQARSMRPLPGFKASALPGGFEHDREQEYGRLGIPIGVETVKALTGLARELGLRVPWSGDSPEGA